MKNKLSVILEAMTVSVLLFSQVSVNIPNPQDILNFYRAQDNSITGVPASIQQINDFTVNNKENVRIGKAFPTEKVNVELNIQFSGTLKPDGSTGTLEQVLTSQGEAFKLIWGTGRIVPVVATVKSEESMFFTSGSTYKLKIDTIEQDIWSEVNINNNEIKINHEGYYLVQAQLGLNGSKITTTRLAILLKKGTTEVQRMQAPAEESKNTDVNLIGIHHFAANDVITICAFQDTGDAHSWDPVYLRFSVAKLNVIATI